MDIVHFKHEKKQNISKAMICTNVFYYCYVRSNMRDVIYCKNHFETNCNRCTHKDKVEKNSRRPKSRLDENTTTTLAFVKNKKKSKRVFLL